MKLLLIASLLFVSVAGYAGQSECPEEGPVRIIREIIH